MTQPTRRPSVTVSQSPLSDQGCEECGDAGIRAQDFSAAIFDLDGVVTRTARVHAAAWKRLFDEYLQQRAEETKEQFRPFDIESDYRLYVDGKPRYDGIASFLESRGISLPTGDPSDPPDRETVYGLGNRKNGYFRGILEKEGVEVFAGTVTFIQKLRNRDIRTALVSSSRNALMVLEAAGLENLFDVLIDGSEVGQHGLKGKPSPDLFLEAAKGLGVDPEHAIVVEDAISGVEAGRAGGFGLVVGVDHVGQASKLRHHGANVTVSDLAELHIRLRRETVCRAVRLIPRALKHFAEIERQLEGKRAAVFLDYDGTLTPIVERPDLAILSDEMRAAISKLADQCTLAIVSGRDRADVENLVGLDELIYAGSHGFDISGPDGLNIQHEEGAGFAEAVHKATEDLCVALRAITGALVEPKRFAVAVHYRQVADRQVEAVEAAVDEVLGAVPELRKTFGKKVFELRPQLDWDKGRAVLWVLQALGLDGPDVLPFYFGDDTTDEDAFSALNRRGVGILVGCPARETAARYVLDRPADVQRFLRDLSDTLERSHHD